MNRDTNSLLEDVEEVVEQVVLKLLKEKFHQK